MNTRINHLIVAIAAVLALTPVAMHASTVSWTSPANGVFNTAGNWTPNVVPSDTTGAVFNAGGAYAVSFTGNASSSNLVVDGDTVTFALGGNTYSAGRYAGITLTNSATLIVTNGTLRPYMLPAGTLPLLNVSSGSTVRVNSGGTLSTADNNGGGAWPIIPYWNANTTLIVDGGTYVTMQGHFVVPGLTVVTNGGQATMYYQPANQVGTGETIVTGAGSQLTLNSDGFAGVLLNLRPLTIANGASFVGAGGQYNNQFTVKEGSTATVGYMHVDGNSYGDAMRINILNSTLTVSSSPANNRAIALNNYYGSGGLGSQMTLSNGTVFIAAGKSIALLEDQDSANRSELRGFGTIERGTVGANFSIDNTGLIKPGDVSTTPSIGTLAVNNGNLFQTNSVTSSRPQPGLRFEFNASLAGAADLIDITGGLINISTGSNVFANVGGSTLAYGTWEFLIADAITYSPAFDNMATLLAGLTTTLPTDIVTFGVVSFNGQEALQLSVSAIPEPSSMLLLATGGLLLWMRRRNG